MTDTQPGLFSSRDDDVLAATLADAAGRLLIAVRSSGALANGALGDAGDAIANEFLVRALRHARPDDALLSEEMADDERRLGTERVWIVDPLDGTREFRQGRDDFTVHVALAVGGDARAGAVGMPALGRVYSTGSPPRPSGERRLPPRIVVSRSRPPQFAGAVAESIGAKVVRMGSMGAKVIAVGRGVVDAYLHTGGHHEWDAAAPVAVARAAGLHVSHLDGSAPHFNAQDTYQEDLLVCRPELASTLLEAVAPYRTR